MLADGAYTGSNCSDDNCCRLTKRMSVRHDWRGQASASSRDDSTRGWSARPSFLFFSVNAVTVVLAALPFETSLSTACPTIHPATAVATRLATQATHHVVATQATRPATATSGVTADHLVTPVDPLP